MKGAGSSRGGAGVKNGWAGPLLSQGCPPPTPFACAALVPTNDPLLGSCHACCWLNCMPNCMIVVQAQLGCAPVQVGLIGPNRLPHPRCAYCTSIYHCSFRWGLLWYPILADCCVVVCNKDSIKDIVELMLHRELSAFACGYLLGLVHCSPSLSSNSFGSILKKLVSYGSSSMLVSSIS